MKLIDKIKNFVAKTSTQEGMEVEPNSAVDISSEYEDKSLPHDDGSQINNALGNEKLRSKCDDADVESSRNTDATNDVDIDIVNDNDMDIDHDMDDDFDGMEDDDDIDFALIDLSERIEFEAEMIQDNPNNEPIHLVESPDILLTDLLRKLGIAIDEKSVSACYVVIDDWMGKSCHTIDNIGEYTIFRDMLDQEENGGWYIQGMGRSVIVHLVYGNSAGKGYLSLHLSSQGFIEDNECLYSRISIVHKRPRTDEVSIHKVLLTFDAKDPQKVLDAIENVRSEAIEKEHTQQELSQWELLSLGYPRTFPETFNSAQKRMNDERWGDAISDLMTHFDIMKKLVAKNQSDEQFVELFARVCFLLSVCYYSKELHMKGYYFASLACHYTNRAEPQEIQKRCQIVLRHPKEYAEILPVQGVYPLSLVLESYFDICPNELSEMLWVNNQTMQSGTIRKQSDIWKFDIKEAMKDTDNLSLYISYRQYRDACKEDAEFGDMDGNIDDDVVSDGNDKKERSEDSSDSSSTTRASSEEERFTYVDKSICKVDNSVIVQLTKDRGVITLTAIVPRFKLADNNNSGYPNVITFKYLDCPSVTSEEYEDIRKRVQQKAVNNEELDEIERLVLGTDDAAHVDAYNGLVAYRNKIWGDSIYYLSKVYYSLAGPWLEGQLDEADAAMMTTVCFNLGFAYNEVRMYECALYYLEILSTCGHIPYMIEYINTLTNSQDPRAWSFVQNEYAKLMEGTAYQNADEDFKHMYTSFLKRRKGYILIDLHRYAEAKALFTNLLEEPESREMAEGELEYIRRCMEEEEN